MNITFVGHLCIDVNVVKGVAQLFHGGGVFHGAMTAQRLGAQATVHTLCAAADRDRFSELSEAGVNLLFHASPTSTSIRNEYPGEDPDERISRVLSRAAPFDEAMLEGIDAEVLHINPLWFGEFPPELIPAARRKALTLCADAQGFLRHVLHDGRMSYADWAEKARYLPMLDLLKVDIKEARMLTGQDEAGPAARLLHEMGVAAVLLTHEGGVCLHDHGGLLESPFAGYTLEGRTGRGDTCTAAFIVAREFMGSEQAIQLAARVTSEKMQYQGPYRGSRIC